MGTLSAASGVLRSTPAKFNGVTVETGDLLACDGKAEMSRRLAASVGGPHSGWVIPTTAPADSALRAAQLDYGPAVDNHFWCCFSTC